MKFTDKEKQKLKNFHGHLDPYVLLGYKIGRLAVTKLRTLNKSARGRPASGGELRTDYFGPAKTPYTCLVDGLQIATSCTYGKRNIKIHNQSGLPKIIFKTQKKKFVVKLKQELISTKQVYCSVINQLVKE